MCQVMHKHSLAREMHSPHPSGAVHVSGARVAPMNRKVMQSHGFVLKRIIQVKVITFFFLKRQNDKNYITDLWVEVVQTLSCMYSQYFLCGKRKGEGRKGRLWGNQSLLSVCFKSFVFSYCLLVIATLANWLNVSAQTAHLLLCFWEPVTWETNSSAWS